MKRKIARIWIVLSMVICLAFSGTASATSVEKENAYKAAVIQLETYIESLSHDSTELEGILDAFIQHEKTGC